MQNQKCLKAELELMCPAKKQKQNKNGHLLSLSFLKLPGIVKSSETGDLIESEKEGSSEQRLVGTVSVAL